jgi:hypothetical protein
LIPSEIHGAIAYELIDDFGLFYEGRQGPIEAGLFSNEDIILIEELYQLIERVMEKKLMTPDAVQFSIEWEGIRQFSRKILKNMKEEIRKPLLPRGKSFLLACRTR